MIISDILKKRVEINDINIKNNLLIPFIKCLKLIGKDSLSFINNIASFNVSKMKDGSSERGLFLNKFGKILTDAYLYKLNSATLYLLVFDYKLEEVIKHLNSLVLINDVKIEKVENFRYIVMHTDNFEQNSETKEELQDDIIAKDEVISGKGYYISKNDRFFIGDVNVDVEEISNKDEKMLSAINYIRLKNKIPYVVVDFDNNILANEVSDWIPIDISKGCFIGQEYVARVKFRGRLHRKLVFFSVAEHLVENLTEGILRICSSYYDKTVNEIHGFGYLNLDYYMKSLSS